MSDQEQVSKQDPIKPSALPVTQPLCENGQPGQA